MFTCRAWKRPAWLSAHARLRKTCLKSWSCPAIRGLWVCSSTLNSRLRRATGIPCFPAIYAPPSTIRKGARKPQVRNSHETMRIRSRPDSAFFPDRGNLRDRVAPDGFRYGRYLEGNDWQAGHTDWKSVVKGQSVSVRVDLGGRSNIKKKKK